MAGLVYRHAWDGPRKHDLEFAVYSHGIAERMPAGHLRYTTYVDDWLLIYFHDSAEIDTGTGFTAVPPGSIIVWAPGDMRAYGHAGGPWDHSWIQVTGYRVKPLLDAIGLRQGHAWSAGSVALIEHGIRQIHAEVTTPVQSSPRILGNLFENWLLMLNRSRHETGGDANLRLRALKSHLDTHANESLSLAAMAKRTAMSPSHLSAVFKSHYGFSPIAYHILRRMDTARYLLVNRSIPITEVADLVGYPELQAFSRMFKRVVGISPRAYREQEQLKQKHDRH